MSERTKHSKLGIASCLIALGIWFYLGLTFFLVIEVNSFSKFLDDAFSKLMDSGGTISAVVALIFLFGVIPIGGHLLGEIFGIVGSFSRTKIRTFAVIGMILNFLPVVVGLIIFVTGY